jgi:hypothetical protein
LEGGALIFSPPRSIRPAGYGLPAHSASPVFISDFLLLRKPGLFTPPNVRCAQCVIVARSVSEAKSFGLLAYASGYDAAVNNPGKDSFREIGAGPVSGTDGGSKKGTILEIRVSIVRLPGCA